MHVHPHIRFEDVCSSASQQKSGELSPKIKGVAMVTVGHFRVDLSCISAVEAGL